MRHVLDLEFDQTTLGNVSLDSVERHSAPANISACSPVPPWELP